MSSEQATQAQADLLHLTMERWPYRLLEGRAWLPRRNLKSYDASYVATTEPLTVPLITLDHRIATAPGTTADCSS